MTEKITMPKLPLLLMPFLLAACGSQGTMKEFASVTAANVSVVNSALARFADDSSALTKDRAQTMQDLAIQLDRSERQLAEDYIILERMGESSNFDALNRLLSESREIRLSDRQVQSSDTLEAILASQSALNAPSGELRGVTKTLGALGKERSARDNIRFYATFAAQVIDDIEEARELQDQANQDARSAANSARSNADILSN